mmetsp:Transcript_138958/g.196699  ORF Transcript_138958/g.196699 Transcript_138958/m.196699 type:complete len:80 (-) Transcript_138958:699-938(-)
MVSAVPTKSTRTSAEASLGTPTRPKKPRHAPEKQDSQPMEDTDGLAAEELISVDELGPPTQNDFASVILDNTRAMLARP